MSPAPSSGGVSLGSRRSGSLINRLLTHARDELLGRVPQLQHLLLDAMLGRLFGG